MDSIIEFAPLVQISTKSILEGDKIKNILFTTNIKVELPIFLSEQGNGHIKPITMMDLFENTVKEHLKEEALYIERNGIWEVWTWNHYNKEVFCFAKALINVGIEPYKTVNILGYNSPEWFTAYIGGMHACIIPVGIYNTNNSETCIFIGEHSEVGCLVLDSLVQYRKYEKELAKLKHLKAIVFYCELSEIEMKSLVNTCCTVFIWKDFIEFGKKSSVDLELNHRIKMQRPGNCCNIVYTSGTTGIPKAVMLSHDNLTWSARSIEKSFGYLIGNRQRLLSFLPLSHIAGQVFDIIMSMLNSNYVYFARPDALSGSLPETIRYVKPTIFFSVPRIYEKFQDKIKEVLDKTTGIKKKIAKWSMKIGSYTVDKKFEGQPPSFFFKIANYLFFSKIRIALGFENTRIFYFGAAPLKKSTIEFFKSLNIPLYNNYGLSETTGPHFFNFGEKNVDLFSAGTTLPGADSRIINQDKDGVGEICCRGRNRFMGYYKDDKSTIESIDQDGFLHTGDQGYLNSKGNLIITGRIKELIVTAGGENVAPLPIEDLIKESCKFMSNVVIIGDDRKYLTALITLKTELNGNLYPESLEVLENISSDCRTSIDAMNDSKVKTYIQGLIENINRKAVSRAQIVKKWMILPHDFTVDGGEFTPTMKLKRKYINQKYAKEIEKMYSLPKY